MKNKNGLCYIDNIEERIHSMNLNSKQQRLIDALKADHMIFVYSMGKAGSTTIYESLNNAGIPSLHFHGFDYNNSVTKTHNYKKYSLSEGGKFLSKRRMVKYLIRNLSLTKNKLIHGKVKMIIPFREPLSRSISTLFQNLELRIYQNYREEKYDITDDLFLEKLLYTQIGTNVINWFDFAVKKSIGIDVYQYPFNKEKGYTIIKEGKYEILLLKMEKMSQCEKEIGQFLGLDDFKLINSNIGNNKWYQPVYEKFKNEFVPNEEYLNKLFDSKYVRHFYSEEEIKQYRNAFKRHMK